MQRVCVCKTHTLYSDVCKSETQTATTHNPGPRYYTHTPYTHTRTLTRTFISIPSTLLFPDNCATPRMKILCITLNLDAFRTGDAQNISRCRAGCSPHVVQLLWATASALASGQGVRVLGGSSLKFTHERINIDGCQQMRACEPVCVCVCGWYFFILLREILSTSSTRAPASPFCISVDMWCSIEKRRRSYACRFARPSLARAAINYIFVCVCDRVYIYIHVCFVECTRYANQL